jgi:GH15 family glucan-1,4-alpha-glucosidase
MKNPGFLRRAAGGPGIELRWTHGAKGAVDTAYSISSRVWYTLDAGCVTEVYYPTIDTPQIRDLQFLFTDGDSFFHDERRNFTSEIDCITEATLGFEVTSRENEGRYTLHKTILGDPYQNCLLINVRVEAPPELLSKLKMFVRPTSRSVAGTTTAKFYKLGITSFFLQTKEIDGSRLGLLFRSQKHLVDMSA